MLLLNVCTWMIRRAALTPLGWLWMALSLALIPSLESLTPRAHGHQHADNTHITYQVAFLSLLYATGLGLSALQENGWILRRCGTIRRFAIQAVGLLSLMLLGAPLVLISSFWGAGEVQEPLALALALSISALHLSCLGSCLIHAPGGRGTQVLLVPLLAWVLPALIAPLGGVAAQLASLVGALHPPSEFRELSPAAFSGAFGSIMFLAATALLLKSERTPAPAPAP